MVSIKFIVMAGLWFAECLTALQRLFHRGNVHGPAPGDEHQAGPGRFIAPGLAGRHRRPPTRQLRDQAAMRFFDGMDEPLGPEHG